MSEEIVRRALAAFAARDVEAWVECADRRSGVWLGHTTIVGKGESPTVDVQSAYLCEVRAGKIVYFRPYQSHQEALEAAGLSE